jgi:hypothetical protein
VQETLVEPLVAVTTAVPEKEPETLIFGVLSEVMLSVAELPESEKFISCKTGKRVRTVGNKWSNMQVVNFNTNSQPQYIALSPDGKILAEPVGYTSTENYLNFLKTGLKKVTAAR